MDPKFLVQLVQIGGIGGSLAFLLLGFTLLREEQRRKIARRGVLVAIFAFMGVSFVFFLAGCGALILERNSERIVDYALKEWEGNYVDARLVQIGLNQWDRPDKQHLSFTLTERPFQKGEWLSAGRRSEIQVIVAVRRNAGQPATRGTYPIAFGPYKFASRPRHEETLTEEQQAALGTGQVTFTVFGVPATTTVPDPIPVPLEPSKVPGLFVIDDLIHK